MDVLRKYCAVVSCIIVCYLQTIHARDNSGGCVYSFQVWSPNQDVLQRLQELEKQCEAVSTSVERRMLDFEKELLKETLSSTNLTHTVERQLLQYRLEDVQITLSVKDVRLEMAEVKSDHNRLWQAFEDAKLLAMEDIDIPGLAYSVSEVRQVAGRLQNGVGDLKAEWLLIKREVQGLKTENDQLKFGHDDMKDDAIKLKQRIEDIWGEMQKVMGRGHGGNIKPSTGTAYVEHNQGNLMEKMGQLNKDVGVELSSIRAEWRRIKAELLNRLAPDLTKDELAILLNKPPLKPMEHPKDCDDIFKLGYHTSGVYQIMPNGAPMLDNVYCEMVNNTGWTLLQRRVDGTLSFNRMWLEYMSGFGSMYGSFWLGNEMIHTLTSSKAYMLRVDIWDWNGLRTYAEYSTFKVDSKTDNYRLHVRDYTGNAGDSLSYHDGMAFSTKDSDSDLNMRNCAADNKGGWWYNSCYASNLNGLYKTGFYTQSSDTFSDGIVWFTLRNSEKYSLRGVEMKIRPINKK